MLYKKLSIAVTERCNAECAFCCLSCSPRKTRVLSVDDMKRAISEASDAGVEEICFTGGEALLYADRVIECASYAASLGLSSAIYTNGFWGSDARRAIVLANEMRAAGVRRVCFSVDAYHEQYVPLETLRTAMRISEEAGLACELTLLVERSPDDTAWVMQAMPAECASAKVSAFPLQAVGRAKGLLAEDELYKAFRSDQARCIHEQMALLSFDGYFYPCCSIYFSCIPRLRIGHMSEMAFTDVEDAILSDDYLHIMIREGFGWYLRRMAELGYEVPEAMPLPCAYCELVFNNAEFIERIADEVRERVQLISAI